MFKEWEEGAEIKIPASTITNLRDLYNTKKIGIMAAKK